MAGPGHMRGIAKPKDTKKTFARLFAYLRDYPVQLLVIVCSLILSSGAAVFGTYMLKPLFNSIAALFAQGASSMLPMLGSVLALAAIYALGALGTFLGNRLLLNVSTGILEKVRRQMFAKLQKLPLRYFDSRTHGEIMSRFSNDTDTLREMLSQGIPQLLTSSITIIGVIVMMLLLSPVLLLVVFVVFLLMLFVIKGKNWR